MKVLWLVFVLAVLSLSTALVYHWRVSPATPVGVPSPSKPLLQPPVTTTPAPTATEPPAVIKKPLSNVPFYSQAPFQNWDALHEDACEEASTLMVKYWLEGAHPSLAAYDQDLKDFIGWQGDHGYGISVDTGQLQKAVKDYYGLTLSIETVNSAAELKKLLDTGHPVIWPANGKKLHNPNFTDGGPLYHMLVVIGYAGDNFITQDPGTRKGERYQYDSDVLLGALANWDGSQTNSSDHRVLVANQ